MGTGRQLPKVVVLDKTVNVCAVDLLCQHFDVTWLESGVGEAELARELERASGVLVRKGRLGQSVLTGAGQLRIIARHGSGVDSIDMEFARQRGIVVTTTGPANVSAVAEFTIALMMAGVRGIAAASSAVHGGTWRPQDYVGTELSGRTMGVVGYGQIGQRVAGLARAIGMRVVAADPFVTVSQVCDDAVDLRTYDDLLSAADVLTFHVRLNDATRGMFNRGSLPQVKFGAFLVNTSRGEVCEEAALIEGLDTGVLRGAALDTFAMEPLPSGSPLRGRPDVVMTPHVAGQTEEALVAMAMTAADELITCIGGGTPRYPYF